MGKELWTGSSVLKRLFREFFIRIADDNKDARSFRSFNKQSQELETYSPQIIVFEGENGLGKTTSIAQCVSMVEEIGNDLKKNIATVCIDFENFFLEKGLSPSSNKDLINSLFTIIQSTSISHFFNRFKEYNEKIAKVSSQIELLIREEWPCASQNLVNTSDVNDTQILFITWLQKNLSKQDFEIYSKGDQNLINLFISSVIDVSMENPLLLCFDGYEYLPESLETWFREEFIRKIYEQKNPIITILSGYETISRLYRNEFPEDLIFTFDFSSLTFTRNDINYIASNLECKLTESEIKRIENYTAGLPMAAIDIIKYVNKGYACTELVPDHRNEIWNTLEIIQGIVDRFLLYCKDDKEKYYVFSLAVMDQFEPDILADLWEVTTSEIPEIISSLQKHYIFITSKKFHQTAKKLFRDYLLKECRNEDFGFKKLFINYKEISQKHAINQLTRCCKELAVKQRYTDDKYIDTIINLFNSSLWSSSDDTMKSLAGLYIEFSYFNPDLASQLIWRTEEFEKFFQPEELSFFELLKDSLSYCDPNFVKNRTPVDSKELEVIEFIEKYTDSMTLFQKSLLAKKKGELHLRSGQLVGAMEQYKICLKILEEDGLDSTLIYDNFLQLGQIFKSLKDLDSVIAVYSLMSSIRNDNFLPHYETGLCRIQLGQFEEGIRELTNAVKINPDNQDAWYNLGLAYSALQHYETAVDSLTKAAEKGPENEFILFEMGKALNKLNKHEEAVEALSKVFTINPNQCEALLTAGQSYSAIGNLEESINVYKKALEINPDKLEVIKELARALYSSQLYQESADMFEQAIKLDSDNAQLWTDLAVVWYEFKKYENAIEAGKKSTSLSLHDLEPWMTLGNAYTALNKYSDAIAAYSKASEIEPSNALIFCLIGKNYLAQKEYEKAIQAFTSAITQEPSLETAWFDMGLSYSAIEKYSDAADAFSKAAKIEPQKSYNWRQLGDAYMALEKFTDAVSSYSNAVLLEPQSHEFLYRKGLACFRINDIEGAITSFVKAAEINDTLYDIWYQMGLAYFAAAHFNEAVQAFQMASNLDSSKSEVWIHLGIAMQELGFYEESSEAFAKALDIVPDNGDVWMRLGTCNFYLQQYPEAIKAYKKALPLDPENIDILQQLGFACHAAGELNPAIEYYRIITEKNPDNYAAWFNMALALHAKGDLDNAIQVYKRAISGVPNDANSWYNLGLAYHGNNELNEAIKAYRHATKIDPDLPEIWFNLGNVFNALEQYGEAIQAYRKVIQISPDYIDAWFNLGLSYFIWGQYEDAFEAYVKVIGLKPDHFEALCNLSITSYTQKNFDKIIEYGLKALEFQDDGTIRTYLIAAYTQKQQLDKVSEQIDALLMITSTQDEIAKYIDILKDFQSKNGSLELIENLLVKLSEAASLEFTT